MFQAKTGIDHVTVVDRPKSGDPIRVAVLTDESHSTIRQQEEGASFMLTGERAERTTIDRE